MSRMANCRDCGESRPAAQFDQARRCTACQEALAARLVEAKRLVLAGFRSAEIRNLIGVPRERVNTIVRGLTEGERRRRGAARAVQPRTFAVPTSTGGRIYGRLDGNPDVVEAVRRREGLDPWDFEETAA